MKTEKEVNEIIEQFEIGDNPKAFIMVYLDEGDIEKFKQEFLVSYNKNVKLFKDYYLSLKEDEGADWEFQGWPRDINDKQLMDVDGGVYIRLENYCLEVFGNAIPIPIEYSVITDTIDNIQDIKYEYEGIINTYFDPEMEPMNSCFVHSKGLIDFSFTWNLLTKN